jgi:hypothetical protein
MSPEYPSLFAILKTFFFVASLIRPSLLSTLDTVEMDTPDASEISLRVATVITSID